MRSGYPNSHMDRHEFNLSRHRLSLQIPVGNCTDIPNPQGTFDYNAHIFDHSMINEGIEGSQIIADRSFKYSGFLGENLGRLRFLIQAHLLNDSSVNLTVADQFQDHIKHLNEKISADWNRQADEFAQIQPPSEYNSQPINGASFLDYVIESTTKVKKLYATPVSHNAYLTFEFSYTTGGDDDTWKKDAQMLEKAVMGTISFK